jgi:hypothetical protein
VPVNLIDVATSFNQIVVFADAYNGSSDSFATNHCLDAFANRPSTANFKANSVANLLLFLNQSFQLFTF